MNGWGFEQIYRKYERELYAFIYSIARRDSYAAEDILQNTMINVYKYLYTLRDKMTLKPWLFSIAKKEASRYYLKKEFDMEIISDDVESIMDTNSNGEVEPDFSIDFINNENFVIIISELSHDEQSIMFLRYKFGLRLNEIAEIWNVNNNTVKIMHFRAIKKLKESLMKKGYHLDPQK